MPRRNQHSSNAGSTSSDEESPRFPTVVESLERLAKSGPLPSLVAFDLDYTLWPLWVDTHVDGPLKRKGDAFNKVVDRNGQPLSFFPHVPSILFFLNRHHIKVASASRTSSPSTARQALNGLVLIDEFASESKGTTSSPRRSGAALGNRITSKANALFDFNEIYPGSKISHFRNIQRDSGVAFQDMIFFDDEYRNSEVGTKLGVHFVEVGHQGLDYGTFEKGIREWREKMKARNVQDSSNNGSITGDESDSS